MMVGDDMKEQRSGKVYVMFRVKGDDIDPGEVAELLRLEPTRSFRKGELFRARDRMHPRAYGMWMLSTEKAVTSEELVDHCNYLLERLRPVRAEIDRVRARVGVEVTVAFWWEPTDGPTGFTFPSRDLRELSEMCNNFDFYFA